MYKKWSSLYRWLASGLTSSNILIKIIELVWNMWRQNFNKVASRKDKIGQKFNEIFLEGTGHEFTQPPINQYHFRKVILKVEKYDMKLSNKMASLRHFWVYSALKGNEEGCQAVFINPDDLKLFEECRREAVKLAYEIKEEIKKKWII